MAQIAIIESKFSIKSSAETFYQAYCNKQKLFPMMSSNIIKDMQLINGSDFKLSVGTVIKWIFASTTGNLPSQSATIATEAIDEKNKSVTCRVIDGDVKKLYSNYTYTLQVTNSSEGNGASVKMTLEYEKQNSDVPEPTLYFDLATAIYQSIDAYLVNNPNI